VSAEADSVELPTGLARVLARAGIGPPGALARLTGGATMESWRFTADDGDYVLRRAPSSAFIADRPFGHATEAAVIRAARRAGVTAPEVVTVLEPRDGLGSGFIMRALPGTSDPREILAMEQPGRILEAAARDLARVHSLRREDLPANIPEMDYREALGRLRTQFEEAGGDRPIIAIGLRWLEDNLPEWVEPVLNHGDFRLGNILAEDSRLTGVLDWELVHFGDRHEDLAFGCMPVWRFSRYDRPALGLGIMDDYFSAYEAESGHAVDRARIRFWLVYRTVWWALGCLRCAHSWRDGSDRTLERAVISRRTSEQELDLLMLLEHEAPPHERARPLSPSAAIERGRGEADFGELAIAVSEWLATIKDKVGGHDRFQLAVARNALGMLARGGGVAAASEDRPLAQQLLSGEVDLSREGLLATLRRATLDKLGIDVPKYPALAVARRQWTEED
jgi:aminoglycoside phosphotransferase (APT) family kinase protein